MKTFFLLIPTYEACTADGCTRKNFCRNDRKDKNTGTYEDKLAAKIICFYSFPFTFLLF